MRKEVPAVMVKYLGRRKALWSVSGAGTHLAKPAVEEGITVREGTVT